MKTQEKRLGILLTIPIILLIIPAVAMQFSNEVSWTAFDFIVAGILLFGTVALIELGLRKLKERKYRILFVLVILCALFIIWAELAVGIFGTRFAGS